MDLASLWRVHVYKMSDPDAQESVADLLVRVDGLTVECTDAPELYLIVGCRDLNQARCVHRLVTLSDRSATLVPSAGGRSAAPIAMEATL